MADANTALIAATAILIFLYIKKATLSNQLSFNVERSRDAMVEGRPSRAVKTYADITHEWPDPGNVKSRADSSFNPVEKNESGPFGIPRQIRREPGTEVYLPTFGIGFGKNI